jgi:pimeloyl-ACP methyl ester carboxylesterase
MQVIVNSLLTNYHQMGKGKTILLLHGWGDSGRGLAKLQTALAQHYQVVAVDLPGFGSTQTPEVAWGLDDYADFVKGFVAKVGLGVDVIMGHSNGGAIAVRALGRGLEAKRLVLIASAGIRGEYKGRMKALRLVAKTGKLLLAPLPAGITKKLRRKVYTSVGSDMLVAEHLQETFKRIVTDDIRSDAAKLRLPALLIYGDKDVSTPLRFGQKLQSVMPDAKLVVIHGGEHTLPTEHPDEIVRYVTEFLND